MANWGEVRCLSKTFKDDVLGMRRDKAEILIIEKN